MTRPEALPPADPAPNLAFRSGLAMIVCAVACGEIAVTPGLTVLEAAQGYQRCPAKAKNLYSRYDTDTLIALLVFHTEGPWTRDQFITLLAYLMGGCDQLTAGAHLEAAWKRHRRLVAAGALRCDRSAGTSWNDPGYWVLRSVEGSGSR